MAQGDTPGLAGVPAPGDGPPADPKRSTETVTAAFVDAANRLAQEVEDMLPGQNKQTQIRLLSALGAFWKSR